MTRIQRSLRPVLPLILSAVSLVYTGCSSKPNDAQLTANVQSKIGSDTALQGQPIAATVHDGTVTLTGTAGDNSSRELAARDASSVDGVKSVVNNITIAGAPSAAPLANGNTTAVPPAAEPSPSSASGNTAAAPAAAPAAPQPIVIPAGTRIRVQLGQTLSSKTNQTGDGWSGTLASPVQINGRTIIRAGAQARGAVSESKSPGRFKGAGVLAIRLDTLRIDGNTYAVRTSRVERVEKGKGKRTAIMTGGGAGLGAIIGGVAGGGKGALIGGLVGGGGGAAGSAFTGNHDIVLPAETILTFRLENSVTIQR